MKRCGCRRYFNSFLRCGRAITGSASNAAAPNRRREPISGRFAPISYQYVGEPADLVDAKGIERFTVTLCHSGRWRSLLSAYPRGPRATFHMITRSGLIRPGSMHSSVSFLTVWIARLTA